MATKYQQMAEEYAEWIDGIKTAQAEINDLQEQIAAAEQSDDRNLWCDLAEQCGYLSDEEQESRAVLSQVVRDEYMAVPFRQAREAGIAGFWREAGLRPL